MQRAVTAPATQPQTRKHAQAGLAEASAYRSHIQVLLKGGSVSPQPVLQ